jgi:transposase
LCEAGCGNCWEEVEALDARVLELENRLGEVLAADEELRRLMTCRGWFLLAAVIRTEVGEVTRFAGPQQLSAHAGVVPGVVESGSKRRYGPLRRAANRHLRWAFVEAANARCRVRGRYPERHTSRPYERVARRRGHQKAIGAVARHLSEAAYWILARKEDYRKPGLAQGSVNAASVMKRFKPTREIDCGTLPGHPGGPERAKR